MALPPDRLKAGVYGYTPAYDDQHYNSATNRGLKPSR
jgi:hypothetical protein